MTANNDSNLKAHAALLGACIIWGLMAPMIKDAMQNGLNTFTLITFRAVGGAFCFWLASLFTRSESVRDRDLCLFFFAGLLGVVLNQCCFTLGLSYTSPINASIITTLVPIFTLILAAIFLHEPVTNKKVLGIFCGAIGALLLITGGQHDHTGAESGNWMGDVLCLTAEFSFALYLTIFKRLISRYSVITCMKWMFTYASIVIIPFTFSNLRNFSPSALPPVVWGEALFAVVGATFVAYLLMMYGQKSLRPTVVSMYNYAQPIVACVVSVAVGIGIFGWMQGLAVVLIFGGVYLVTRSKSRADVVRQKAAARKVQCVSSNRRIQRNNP